MDLENVLNDNKGTKILNKPNRGTPNVKSLGEEVIDKKNYKDSSKKIESDLVGKQFPEHNIKFYVNVAFRRPISGTNKSELDIEDLEYILPPSLEKKAMAILKGKLCPNELSKKYGPNFMGIHKIRIVKRELVDKKTLKPLSGGKSKKSDNDILVEGHRSIELLGFEELKRYVELVLAGSDGLPIINPDLYTNAQDLRTAVYKYRDTPEKFMKQYGKVKVKNELNALLGALNPHTVGDYKPQVESKKK